MFNPAKQERLIQCGHSMHITRVEIRRTLKCSSHFVCSASDSATCRSVSADAIMRSSAAAPDEATASDGSSQPTHALHDMMRMKARNVGADGSVGRAPAYESGVARC